MPYFKPPVVYDNPPFLPETRGRVLMFARHRPAGPRGRSVLKNGSVYTTVDVPTSDQIDAATIAYIGGHIYEISDAEYNALIAAGFTPIIALPGFILVQVAISTDLLITDTGESITDESDVPLGWDSEYAFTLTDGFLTDESGNRLISEYV